MKSVFWFIIAWAWFMGFLFFYLEGPPKPFWNPPTPRVEEQLIEEVPAEAVPFCADRDQAWAPALPAWGPGNNGNDKQALYAPCTFIPWKGAA